MMKSKYKRKSKTCIAVLKYKGKLYMAGDRRVTFADDTYQKMPRPKIRKRNNCLMGATGDGYLCALFVDVFDPPEIKATKYADEIDYYMHHTFYDSFKRLLKSRDFDRDHYAYYLFGVKGKLFGIEIGISVINGTTTFGLAIDELSVPHAVGCGGAMALGSLHTSEDSGLSVKKRLDLALKVAAKVSAGCDEEIDHIWES